MAVNAVAGHGVSCRRCGMVDRNGDRFCESCGTALNPVSPVIPAQPPPWLDDEGIDSTTRYLCAAAHLDPEFARNAIGDAR